MIHISRMRVRLRIAYATFGAVIAANAAAAILRQINIVSQEDGKRVRLNLRELGDESLQLRIKPVDVHQSRLKAEYRTRSPIARRWTQSLLCQDRRAAQ